ncbi:MAG: hypothetical protein Q8903_00785 [Bacteroidota bacterium]|nr:hypothetical protein [Bacteroidota bacterium]
MKNIKPKYRIILPAILLLAISINFIHSEFDFLNCISEAHDSHDYCHIVDSYFSQPKTVLVTINLINLHPDFISLIPSGEDGLRTNAVFSYYKNISFNALIHNGVPNYLVSHSILI